MPFFITHVSTAYAGHLQVETHKIIKEKYTFRCNVSLLRQLHAFCAKDGYSALNIEQLCLFPLRSRVVKTLN
jgi:hypothetical protein